MNFTRNFAMCPQACVTEDHYVCVSPQLSGDCVMCTNNIERLPESEFRLN